MTRRLNLCLAVCTRDDGATLPKLLAQAKKAALFDEILVIDDGSAQPEKSQGVRLIRHDRPLGIGAARNAAIAATECDYLLFVDADDCILPELSALIADLGETGGDFDLCLFRHIDSRSAAQGRAGQTELDDRLWQQAGHSVGVLAPARPGALPILARTTNYPWNKIFRTGFLRKAEIRCASTAVHEDMALHWLALMRADRVMISDRACLWHTVATGDGVAGRRRLTSRRDGVRLQVFPAMDVVVKGMETEEGAWRDAFLDYSLTLTDWAEAVIHDTLRPKFRAEAARWFAALSTRWGPDTVEPTGRLSARIAFAAPPATGRARIRLALCGPHSRRSPFGYQALEPLWQDRIVLVTDPDGADLAVCAHPRDAGGLPPADCGIPLALFSEEPFWDSLFSPDPLAPMVEIAGRALHQVNHHASPVFAFDRIPYFLLTDHGFAGTYAHAFSRNARRSPDDWLHHWQGLPRRCVFMAERRPEPFHDIAFPAGDIRGLCAWRTRLADMPGGATGLGASWQGGPSRLELPDWHMDKLAQLDGRARIISAIENTHQPGYLSEKLFDAFACGGMPLYIASARHRLYSLGLGDGAWINLHGMDEAAAADHIAAWTPTQGNATDYAAAQARLAQIFGDTRIWLAERQRLGRALVAEVTRLVDLGPAAIASDAKAA